MIPRASQVIAGTTPSLLNQKKASIVGPAYTVKPIDRPANTLSNHQTGTKEFHELQLILLAYALTVKGAHAMEGNLSSSFSFALWDEPFDRDNQSFRELLMKLNTLVYTLNGNQFSSAYTQTKGANEVLPANVAKLMNYPTSLSWAMNWLNPDGSPSLLGTDSSHQGLQGFPTRNQYWKYLVQSPGNMEPWLTDPDLKEEEKKLRRQYVAGLATWYQELMVLKESSIHSSAYRVEAKELVRTSYQPRGSVAMVEASILRLIGQIYARGMTFSTAHKRAEFGSHSRDLIQSDIQNFIEGNQATVDMEVRNRHLGIGQEVFIPLRMGGAVNSRAIGTTSPRVGGRLAITLDSLLGFCAPLSVMRGGNALATQKKQSKR